MSLSSIAYFIDSALSNDPILGRAAFLLQSHLKWHGVMEEVMPQSGPTVNGRSSVLICVKGS